MQANRKKSCIEIMWATRYPSHLLQSNRFFFVPSFVLWRLAPMHTGIFSVSARHSIARNSDFSPNAGEDEACFPCIRKKHGCVSFGECSTFFSLWNVNQVNKRGKHIDDRFLFVNLSVGRSILEVTAAATITFWFCFPHSNDFCFALFGSCGIEEVKNGNRTSRFLN